MAISSVRLKHCLCSKDVVSIVYCLVMILAACALIAGTNNKSKCLVVVWEVVAIINIVLSFLAAAERFHQGIKESIEGYGFYNS